jgi:hypothetical protein
MKRTGGPLLFPSQGEIKGGSLAGWRFHFLYFRASPRGLEVMARCTPPAWPFPWDIPLSHEHFGQLRAVPGERAKRLDAEPLIRHAYALAGLEIPKTVATSATLRARVKRAHMTTAKGIAA